MSGARGEGGYGLDDGDVARLLARTSDLLRQVVHAGEGALLPHLRATARFGVHGLVVDLERIAALGLGLVHRVRPLPPVDRRREVGEVTAPLDVHEIRHLVEDVRLSYWIIPHHQFPPCLKTILIL